MTDSVTLIAGWPPPGGTPCPEAEAHDALAREAPHDDDCGYLGRAESCSARWTMWCCEPARAFRMKHWIMRQPVPSASRPIER